MGSLDGPSGQVRAGRNLLLASLTLPDQALLGPYLEEVTIPCGTALIAPGRALDAVFFPGSAVVSLEQESGVGRSVEIGVVGREGMLGWPALLGAERPDHGATIRMRSGTLMRVPLADLRRACRRSPSLHAALLHFVHAIMTQMSRAITCLLRHALDQRLARWLLMRHDRLGGDLISVRHDEIADCLSVRRASVTDVLHVIEGERLVRCTRGRIVMRDRAGLEAFAGDAYGAAEAQYRLLLAPLASGGGPAG